MEANPHYIAGGQLRDHQIEGLKWLLLLHIEQRNGILADEMVTQYKLFQLKENLFLILILFRV